MAIELAVGDPVAGSNLADVEFTPVDVHQVDLINSFVKLFGSCDAHYVTYKSGDGSWYLAHGLGKSSAYPIPAHQIQAHSPKLKLSLQNIFTKAFTYLRSGKGNFMLVRQSTGLHSLHVQVTTGEWFTIEKSVAFLYQLPNSSLSGDDYVSEYIEVVAESDEPINVHSPVDIFDLSGRTPRKVNVSDTVPEIYEYDFSADTFAIHYYD